MLLETYDIECLSNLFTYTGYCHTTKRYYQFVIHKLRNDYAALMLHLQRNGVKMIMIGYNSENYDYPIIHHLINHFNQYQHLDGFTLSQQIYAKSQSIIAEEFSSVADKNKHYIQADLMKILHFDSAAKMTSLKDIEFYLRLDKIEDMPFDHTYWVTTMEEIEQILSYNKHDVYATVELLKIVVGQTTNELYTGQDKIKLRFDIQKEFGIPCLNYNDVKIGEEINKIEYLKRNPHLKAWDLKKMITETKPFTFGECIPSYVTFKTPELQKFYAFLKDIIVDTVSSKDNKQVYPLIFRGTKYTIARGGIHSCDTGRHLKPNENQFLRDADVGSQYPNALRKRQLYPKHLGPTWMHGYVANIGRRIDAKHMGKETKDPKYNSIADTYKLALNGGGFGKTGEPSNWQYDPFVSLSCTIGNQFEILMLIESMELAGIDVKSANTDGIVCLFDKSKEAEYYSICKEWEVTVGNSELGQLEYCDYSALIQTSVNDYIAIKPDGKIKLKGDFAIYLELNKNPSQRIVPIAIRNYFVNGTPIEETIRNHTDIYDFCIRLKTNRSYQTEYHYLKDSEYKIDKWSKTSRYFISKSGGTLYKKEKSTGKMIGVNIGRTVTYFNNYFEKTMEEYNIDYGYYIRECNKIIDQIELKQLSLF